MVLQSWMWDRNTIFSVKNVEDHVPQTVLDAMRNDENLLLDSDDLTKDECCCSATASTETHSRDSSSARPRTMRAASTRQCRSQAFGHGALRA